MVTNETTDAVVVNGLLTAIRITFTFNGKYYARQYAVLDGITKEQAMIQCQQYKMRVLLRAGYKKSTMQDDHGLDIAVLEPQEPIRVKPKSNTCAIDKAKADVQHVLDRLGIRRR